jgi:hypothetical protein
MLSYKEEREIQFQDYQSRIWNLRGHNMVLQVET